MLWSIVSNAEDRTSSAIWDKLLSSRSVRISLAVIGSNVPWWGWHAVERCMEYLYDICDQQMMIYVIYIWWYMWSTDDDICDLQMMIYVIYRWWYMWSTDDDICDLQMMIYVIYIWWYMWHSSIQYLCDICDLQMMIYVTQLHIFQICFYLRNIFWQMFSNGHIHIHLQSNIEVSMTWASVRRMSSRHSSWSEVGMGINAQYVGLEFFIIVYSCEIVTG